MKRSLNVFVCTCLLFFLSAGLVQSQVIGPSPSAPLLTGCVGACGSSYSGSFVAPQTRVYKFKASSSLCPNTDAFVAIIVDGNVAWSGLVVNGTGVKFEAKAGHNVAVVAGISPNGNPIQCVWLGEVNFAVF